MRKAKNLEWYVEFDFVMTKWGKRPMRMMFFPTESEAVTYAELETRDGVVGWMEEI